MPSSAVAACGRGNRLPFGGPWFIYFGQPPGDQPMPSLMVANQATVRDRGQYFDGATIYIPSVYSRCIAPAAISQSAIQADLAGWTAADFGTVNRNWAFLIWCGTDYGPGPGAVANTDWTNDAHWSVIAQNFGNLAAVLRQVGKFVGIFFDNEAYCVDWNEDNYPWNWGGDSNTPDQTAPNGRGILPSHSRPDALALARRRGEEVMDAILDAWPDCHVMMTHSAFASDYYAGEAMGQTMSTGWNNLWWTSELKAPFYYGMVRRTVARGQGYVWDGGEMYGIRNQDDHHRGARFRAYTAPRVPNQWTWTDPLRDYKILISQAIYDRDEWNGFALQPASAMQDQLVWMMRANGSYVWLYTETHDWWGAASSGAKPAVPQAYLDAMRTGREIGRGGLGTGSVSGPSSYSTSNADTVTLTDANSHTFSGGGSSFSDTFTGTNGAAWASPWTTSTGGAGAVVDIQGNRGRMATSSTADLRAGAYYGTLNNGEVLIKASFPNPSTTHTYINVLFRTDGSWSGNFDFPNNGYYLDLVPSDNAAYVYRWDAGSPTMVGSTAYTFTSGVDVWIRLRWNGSSIQARLWNVGTTEPTTWSISITDSTRTTGQWGLSVSSATTASKTVYWDDLSGTVL